MDFIYFLSLLYLLGRGELILKQHKDKPKQKMKLWPSESQLFINFDSSEWDTGFPGGRGDGGKHRTELNGRNLELQITSCQW